MAALGWPWRGRFGFDPADPLVDATVRHNAPVTFSAKPRAEGWLADERSFIELDTWTTPARRAAARTARVIALAEYTAQWIKDRPVKARTRLMYECCWTRHSRQPGRAADRYYSRWSGCVA